MTLASNRLEYHQAVDALGRFGISNIREIDVEELTITCRELGIPGVHSGLALPLLMGTPQIDTEFLRVDYTLPYGIQKVAFIASKVRMQSDKFSLCGFAHKDVEFDLNRKDKLQAADMILTMFCALEPPGTMFTLAYSPNNREIDAGWKLLLRRWAGTLQAIHEPQDSKSSLKRLTFVRV